jgi:hypothetical protein
MAAFRVNLQAAPIAQKGLPSPGTFDGFVSSITHPRHLRCLTKVPAGCGEASSTRSASVRERSGLR